MVTESLENVIHHLVDELSYDESPTLQLNKLRVLNVEYRIIQAKKRCDATMLSQNRRQYCYEMMKQLLASANGVASYYIEINKLIHIFKECKDINQISNGKNLIPATFIACKIDLEHILAIVERFFCVWSPPASVKEISNNLYMQNLSAILIELEEQDYEAICIVGKGDFTKPISRIFSDHIGSIMNFQRNKYPQDN